jgi:hypothetical protein
MGLKRTLMKGWAEGVAKCSYEKDKQEELNTGFLT